MNKVLVDTNILIYALDDKSEFHSSALAVLQHKDYRIYICTKNISEFFAVCTKLKYTQGAIFDFYEDVKTSTDILYPDSNSLRLFESLLMRYQPRGN